MEFWVGGQHFSAPAGTHVYLPRKVEHEWKMDSSQVKMLFMCWPAGIEDYFREFAQPAKDLVIPPLPKAGEIDLERFIERGRAYGIEFHLS